MKLPYVGRVATLSTQRLSAPGRRHAKRHQQSVQRAARRVDHRCAAHPRRIRLAKQPAHFAHARARRRVGAVVERQTEQMHPPACRARRPRVVSGRCAWGGPHAKGRASGWRFGWRSGASEAGRVEAPSPSKTEAPLRRPLLLQPATVTSVRAAPPTGRGTERRWPTPLDRLEAACMVA